MACSDLPPITTLKPRHSLVGKDLLPLLMRFREEDRLPPLLAGISRNKPIDGLTVSELRGHILQLTGRPADQLCLLASKREDRDSLRHCLHLAVVHANEVGAPVGEEPPAKVARQV
jgi:hypothetical protein